MPGTTCRPRFGIFKDPEAYPPPPKGIYDLAMNSSNADHSKIRQAAVNAV